MKTKNKTTQEAGANAKDVVRSLGFTMKQWKRGHITLRDISKARRLLEAAGRTLDRLGRGVPSPFAIWDDDINEMAVAKLQRSNPAES